MKISDIFKKLQQEKEKANMTYTVAGNQAQQPLYYVTTNTATTGTPFPYNNLGNSCLPGQPLWVSTGPQTSNLGSPLQAYTPQQQQSLPPLTGIEAEVAFCDINGNAIRIRVDMAYFQMMCEISQRHYSHAQCKKQLQKMPELDFDLDELLMASELMEKLDEAKQGSQA